MLAANAGAVAVAIAVVVVVSHSEADADADAMNCMRRVANSTGSDWCWQVAVEKDFAFATISRAKGPKEKMVKEK